MPPNWVSGHIAVERNEKADELARKGAAPPLVGPESFCGLGFAFFQERTTNVFKRDGLLRDTVELK